MHAYLFIQTRTKRVHTKRLHRVAIKSIHGPRNIVHLVINQRYFSRFAVIAEQLNINIGQTGSGSMPHGSAQMGPKLGQALHPDHGQAPQGQQFDGLGITAKNFNVGHHGVLNLVVARQGGAHRKTKLLDSAAFGRTVFETLLHHQSGGDGGYFCFKGFHKLHFAPNAPA